MSRAPVRVAVAGASGYGGSEILRWLAGHPVFEVVAVSSRAEAGRPVDDVHPNLFGALGGLAFVTGAREIAEAEADAVVLALPHGAAAEFAGELLEANPGLRLVDLSGDHRLPDPATYASAYGREHPRPEELRSGSWVYGFTEGARDTVRGATRIANPGCFATGALLGMLPLLRLDAARPVSPVVRHVAITGSSGSGAAPTAGTHHPERVETVRAYKVLGHQHVPEIVACLLPHGLPGGTQWLMVPQSGPFARGIFTTLFVELAREIGEADLRRHFKEVYADSPLVRVRAGSPEVARVRNTAYAEVAVHATGRHAVVTTAIDNLCKGMVTQAIQNLNLVFGLAEETGLDRPGGKP